VKLDHAWTTEANQADTVSEDTRAYPVANPGYYTYYASTSPPATATTPSSSTSSSSSASGYGPGSIAPRGTASASLGERREWGGFGAGVRFQDGDQVAGLSRTPPGSSISSAAVPAYTVGVQDHRRQRHLAVPGTCAQELSLLGSNDGVNWDHAGHPDQPGRHRERGHARVTPSRTPASYKYYRLNVSASNGDNVIQLDELQLLADLRPVAREPTTDFETRETRHRDDGRLPGSRSGASAAEKIGRDGRPDRSIFEHSGVARRCRGGSLAGLGWAMKVALTGLADLR